MNKKKKGHNTVKTVKTFAMKRREREDNGEAITTC